MTARTTATLFTTLAMALMLAAAPARAGEIRGRVEGVAPGAPAVVWVEGIAETAPVPEDDTTISHVDGRFEPYVTIGFVGNEFVLRNEDDTLHNTHLYMRLAYQKEVSTRPLQHGATLYNVALPTAGMEVHKAIKPYHRYRDETGFIEVVCNRHPGERAFVLVFDHPYAAVTETDGSFRITGVPAGRREVRVWRAGDVKTGVTVDVGEDEPAELVVEPW